MFRLPDFLLGLLEYLLLSFPSVTACCQFTQCLQSVNTNDHQWQKPSAEPPRSRALTAAVLRCLCWWILPLRNSLNVRRLIQKVGKVLPSFHIYRIIVNEGFSYQLLIYSFYAKSIKLLVHPQQ